MLPTTSSLLASMSLQPSSDISIRKHDRSVVEPIAQLDLCPSFSLDEARREGGEVDPLNPIVESEDEIELTGAERTNLLEVAIAHDIVQGPVHSKPDDNFHKVASARKRERSLAF